MTTLLDRLVVNKSRDTNNPKNLVVSASGSTLIGSVKVKIQMWKTSVYAMQHTQAVVSPIWTTHTGQARSGRVMIPSATPSEIYVDKIKAIVDRSFLKGRDIFDLYWLTEQQTQAGYDLPDDGNLKIALQVRLETYPEFCIERWLEKANSRLEILNDTDTLQKIKTELHKWLPSYWPISDDATRAMLRCSEQCIHRGRIAMQSILNDKLGIPAPSLSTPRQR